MTTHTETAHTPWRTGDDAASKFIFDEFGHTLVGCDTAATATEVARDHNAAPETARKLAALLEAAEAVDDELRIYGAVGSEKQIALRAAIGMVHEKAAS